MPNRSDLDEFLDTILTRQLPAMEAMNTGNPTPWLDMWSTSEPVTLFAAWGPCETGWDSVSKVIRWVGTRLSDGRDTGFELVASGISGDLAYTVGYETAHVSIDGGATASNRLRVTHVYRRENGAWRVVHRHGDTPPMDQSQTVSESARPDDGKEGDGHA
jgi:ketosteroid isomerase-like protein